MTPGWYSVVHGLKPASVHRHPVQRNGFEESPTMSVTEYERNQLFVWFEEHMGKERAATMMSMLDRKSVV